MKTSREIFDDRLKVLDEQIPGYWGAFQHLEKLMNVAVPGTTVVVTPWPCEFLPQLLEEGAIHEGNVRKSHGRPISCHHNVARQWRSKRFSAIGTGFGLSADGLWREHSWGLTSKSIIETTQVRVAYFGVRLTGENAIRFTMEALGS